MTFKKVDPKMSFPKMEEEILKFWDEQKIFGKSVANRDGAKRYSFYDGPPFATGTPHYGHIVASAIKDTVPRYWTMRGYQVERKWGWDCHGLPIENIAEKALGIKHKKEIEEMGVAKFNETCRSKVLEYVDEWKIVIRRFGRWADMEHAYSTMDKDYMESVWWVFKTLWDKGLVYESYRTMHICPRCETTLSQSEVAEGYKDVKDLAVTVKFELVDEPGTFVLAWTTTPWTLPGNVALAVNRDIEYVKIAELKGIEADARPAEKFYISEEIFLREAKEESPGIYTWRKGNQSDFYEIIETIKGSDFIGKSYRPPFNYFFKQYQEQKNISGFKKIPESQVSASLEKDTERKHRDNAPKITLPGGNYHSNKQFQQEFSKLGNGWKIYAADFVTTESGTGVVHIAPAFGEDDMNLGKEKNLPFVQHVNMDGTMKDAVTHFAGMPVKPVENPQEMDIKIIKHLAHNGLLFSKEKYEHSYPHCWRCDTPLLNYATSSWFVRVTEMKPKMLELAKNIHWSPEHIKEGRWGKWLEGARDWSISRQRYWASVMPIWKCECGEMKVFGSVAELEEASGKKIDDLHKHIVDEVTVPCEKCGGTMHRIPDVLDTWFDSGSMPYAQEHYPFENKEHFEECFPSNFIAEGVDQTRAWFYYQHVIGTGIKESNAFQNVIVNGIVLAEDGKKMSKRLQNYPDPMTVIEKHGADALRLYLLSSPIVSAENLNFSERDLAETSRNVFRMLWNSYSFFVLYASIDDWKPTAQSAPSTNLMDRWILSELQLLIRSIDSSMEQYDLQRATRTFAPFIDNLSNWYIRRSRNRFWKSEDDMDKHGAYQTLYTVLVTLSKVMAPFTPFLAEEIYRNLTGEESVHLAEWPVCDDGLIDEKLNEEMKVVRQIVSVGLQLRTKAKIKVRQPLLELLVTGNQLLDELAEIIKEELNVNNIVSVETIQENENFKIGTVGEKNIGLNTVITAALKLEGEAREIIRAIQEGRKKAGFEVADRITLGYQGMEGVFNGDEEKGVKGFVEEISKEILATEVKNEKLDDAEYEGTLNLDGEIFTFQLKRV